MTEARQESEVRLWNRQRRTSPAAKTPRTAASNFERMRDRHSPDDYFCPVMPESDPKNSSPAVAGSESNDGESMPAVKQSSVGVPENSPKQLSPEEQMAAYEDALKEEDWGHQPC